MVTVTGVRGLTRLRIPADQRWFCGYVIDRHHLRAGEENRTPVICLEGRSFATKLRPRENPSILGLAVLPHMGEWSEAGSNRRPSAFQADAHTC